MRIILVVIISLGFQAKAQPYPDSVKSILEGKCGDCHSKIFKSESYKSNSKVKEIADKRIEKAMKKFNLEEGRFDKEDFKDLAKVVKRGEMPPKGYKAEVSASIITEGDKEIILKWLSEVNK